jgi:hypothetical protein
MLYRLLLIFLLSVPPLLAGAQSGSLSAADREELRAAERRMQALLERVHTDSTEADRFLAARDLIRTLVEALDRPNSFNYAFPELDGLSIQYPEDRSFRIFSWELYVDRETYRHYGAIQLNEQDLKLIPLVDRGDDWVGNPENEINKADRWLGYTVYGIREAGVYRGQPYYFLLGYDSYSAYRRRKILDVLRFDESGTPVFGLPVFETYTDNDLLLADRARIIMPYGAEANVTLRFDPELEGVVYENLILVQGSYGEGPIHVPDGSYHLLESDERGIWREREQLFEHTYEEAPRFVPKDEAGRDLLGRERKKPKPPGGGRR